jgi:hypothetical protein
MNNLLCPYDTALPQPWVNKITDTGFDPRGTVVWGYPKGSIFGLPIPLTPISAHKLLSRAALFHHTASFLLAAWADAGVPVKAYFPRIQPVDIRR